MGSNEPKSCLPLKNWQQTLEVYLVYLEIGYLTSCSQCDNVTISDCLF